jgi:hypothetical protein
MKEIWIDYDYMYEISNTGLVRNKQTGLVLACPIDKHHGYRYFTCHGKIKKVHRLVAELFIPNPNNLPQVNHKDGDKTNNDVDNLEWCTNQDNQIHARDHGLTPTGQKCSFSKLTQEQVDFIKLNFTQESPQYNTVQLAEMFDVDRTTISRIKNNNRWCCDTI